MKTKNPHRKEQGLPPTLLDVDYIVKIVMLN